MKIEENLILPPLIHSFIEVKIKKKKKKVYEEIKKLTCKLKQHSLLAVPQHL